MTCLCLQSELAFRMLCRRHGSTAAYTPMLHSRIFLEDRGYREEHFTTCEGDRHGYSLFTLLHRMLPAILPPMFLVQTAGHVPRLLSNSRSCRPLLVQFCANDAATLLAAAKLATGQSRRHRPQSGLPTTHCPARQIRYACQPALACSTCRSVATNLAAAQHAGSSQVFPLWLLIVQPLQIVSVRGEALLSVLCPLIAWCRCFPHG